MPLWESNEIYFVAGLSVLVTLGVFVSLAYFLYKRAAVNGRRADEEQAALEKVLLRKEGIPTTTSPPTKPLIVSPSFSSPNKVPARHLRSGSYSPTHYLSPYHSRQPRRNSSPTSNIAAFQQPKLPQLQLHHPQPQGENLNYPQNPHVSRLYEQLSNGTGTSSVVSQSGNNGNLESSACLPLSKANNDNEQPSQDHPQNILCRVNGNSNGNRNNVPGSLAHHNSQYYGTIPPRRLPRRGAPASAESNLVTSTSASNNLSGGGGPAAAAAFLPLKCGSGAAIVLHSKHNSFIKSEYVQLPGKDGDDCIEEENWKDKDSSLSKENMHKWKNCSDNVDDGSLRRKLLLQKQYQQKLQFQQSNHHHHRMTAEPPGELFKMKHTVSEEIPFYISSQ